MKKFFKFIFGLIGVVLLLIIILTVVLAISLYKKETVAPDYADASLERPTALVINSEVEKAMHNVSTTNNVDLTLDEEALEYLFLSITNSVGEDVKNAVDISGVDVDVKDGKYNLMLSGKVSFYKTLITCGLSFEEDSEAFKIKLEGLKAGKINVYTFRGIASIFLRANKIEESLAKKKIYCDLDFNHFEIVFSKDNIKKMLVDMMGQDQAELVNVLGDIFLSDNSILEFNLGKNDLIGAILHLQMIKYDEAVNGALPYHYDFDSLKANTKSLLENNIITHENTGVVYKYLVNGYDVYKDDQKSKSYIDSLNLTSIGIMNNSLYDGIMSKPEENSNKIVANGVKDALTLSIEQMIINRGFTITITDDTLTEALKTLSLVGFSTAFSNDFTNDVAYVVIEQLNFICEQNKIVVDLIANINGERIYIEVALNTLENNDGLSLTGTIDHIQIGSKDLSDSNKLSLLRYLKNATEEVEWIEVKPTDNVSTSTILFNFAQILNDNSTVGSFMASMTELSLSITNETKVVDGGIVITYHH